MIHSYIINDYSLRDCNIINNFYHTANATKSTENFKQSLCVMERNSSIIASQELWN